MQTARFSSVVERAGRPELYLAWVPPEKDRALQSLVKQGRVMTVHQELRGPHKDFGTVGLHRENGGQIWIFPKSLRRFSEKRIVGIDYQQVAPTRHGAGPAARVKSQPPPAPKTVPTSTKTAIPVEQAEVSAKSRRSDSGKKSNEPRLSESKPAAAPPTPPDLKQVLSEVRRAVGELKRGKSVAAYERLRVLVE
jgi:hypothetical protein